MKHGLDPFHNSYLENVYMWQMCRDTLAGEQRVKSRKTRYLPMPAAMQLSDSKPNINLQDSDQGLTPTELSPVQNLMLRQFNPNFHSNPAYQAYLTRAQFPELPAFILRGLLGLTSNEKPTIKLPSSMEYLLTSSTTSGLSLHDYYMFILSEIISVGRMISVVDINETGQMVMAPYSAESMINWKQAALPGTSKKVPTMVVLAELRDTTPEKITSKNETIYRVLALDTSTDQHFYTVSTLTEVEVNRSIAVKELGEMTLPTYRGTHFSRIPIQVFGPVSNSFNIQNSPIASIASTALQVYMKYADLSNSEFMSCSPTLIISGVAEDFAPKAVGSTVALILPDPDAKAYYTTTDTSALSHVLRHITDLYEQAIHSGAQLLDSSKKAAESAETTRLKQAAAGATLSSVVRNAASGIEAQLKEIAVLMGENPDDVTFTAVTDFSAPALTAKEQEALVKSWIEGAISHSTLLENFRRGGILFDGEDTKDEIERIKADELQPRSQQIQQEQMKQQQEALKQQKEQQQQEETKEPQDNLPPTNK